MMKVFLDTNILIDYVDHREKRIYAGLILSMADEGLITLYASYLPHFGGIPFAIRLPRITSLYASRSPSQPSGLFVSVCLVGRSFLF